MAGGRLTKLIHVMTYRGFVLRKKVIILITIATLDYLDIMLFDIVHAYLNADVGDKVYSVTGKLIGSRVSGAIIEVVKVIYWLNSYSTSFHKYLENKQRVILGYQACIAELDTWLKPAVKYNAFGYYK